MLCQNNSLPWDLPSIIIGNQCTPPKTRKVTQICIYIYKANMIDVYSKYTQMQPHTHSLFRVNVVACINYSAPIIPLTTDKIYTQFTFTILVVCIYTLINIDTLHAPPPTYKPPTHSHTTCRE